jgi:hypothetical protein
MICRAPAIRAPWIAAIPTPPQPNTAPSYRLRSGRVQDRAHTGRHAASDERRAISGISWVIFTRAFSCTSIFGKCREVRFPVNFSVALESRGRPAQGRLVAARLLRDGGRQRDNPTVTANTIAQEIT